MYDRYAATVLRIARQVTTKSVTIVVVKAVELKIYMILKLIEWRIVVGFIKDETNYATLTNETGWEFLESWSKESKSTVSIDEFDKPVERKVRTNLADRKTLARTKDLFIDFDTLLRLNWLVWHITGKKVVVRHLHSAIRFQKIYDSLSVVLRFAEYVLQKNLKGFLSTHHPVDCCVSSHPCRTSNKYLRWMQSKRGQL